MYDAATRDRAIELAAGGLSPRAIARTMRISEATARRWVNEPESAATPRRPAPHAPPARARPMQTFEAVQPARAASGIGGPIGESIAFRAAMDAPPSPARSWGIPGEGLASTMRLVREIKAAKAERARERREQIDAMLAPLRELRRDATAETSTADTAGGEVIKSAAVDREREARAHAIINARSPAELSAIAADTVLDAPTPDPPEQAPSADPSPAPARYSEPLTAEEIIDGIMPALTMVHAFREVQAERRRAAEARAAPHLARQERWQQKWKNEAEAAVADHRAAIDSSWQRWHEAHPRSPTTAAAVTAPSPAPADASDPGITDVVLGIATLARTLFSRH
jgi:hypothetical protein